jgi:hypothetical protein
MTRRLGAAAPLRDAGHRVHRRRDRRRAGPLGTRRFSLRLPGSPEVAKPVIASTHPPVNLSSEPLAEVSAARARLQARLCKPT